MAAATYYYRYRQFVNCQGGGYLEDYNLLTAPAGPTAYPSTQILYTIKSIACLRGQLLEGNSKIANGELSIETLPGMNPAEGFQVPHNVANSVPIVLNDPATGTIETQPGVAIDPTQAIAWRLDTQSFFTELRTLRSLRSSWVNNWGLLYPNINTQLGIWGAALPANGTLITAFPGGSTNPALCIAYFMLYVLVSTKLVQNVNSGGYTSSFTVTPYAAPNSSGSPAIVNPIVVPALTRRLVGEGWPKTKGKMQSFGTHG